MSSEPVLKVLMVCLGNICRSPTAHGILQKRLVDAGLDTLVSVDSAGTGDWHVGKAPDARATEAAAARNYDLAALRARQVTVDDFARFDYVLAMDNMNIADLCRLSPPEQVHKIQRLLDFVSSSVEEVPDPYFGGEDGFEYVLDLVEAACDGFLLQLKADLDARGHKA